VAQKLHVQSRLSRNKLQPHDSRPADDSSDVMMTTSTTMMMMMMMIPDTLRMRMRTRTSATGSQATTCADTGSSARQTYRQKGSRNPTGRLLPACA